MESIDICYRYKSLIFSFCEINIFNVFHSFCTLQNYGIKLNSVQGKLCKLNMTKSLVETQQVTCCDLNKIKCCLYLGILVF